MISLISLFLQLFASFFLIGTFTFGGGYAMLSLIQNEVVVAHSWISETTFTDIIAISQMTPGPIGVNCATYVGYETVLNAGGGHLLAILGSATATFALALPSFLIVLALVKFYTKFSKSAMFSSVMSWLRPCVVGLIGAAAVILIMRVSWGDNGLFDLHIKILEENFPDWKSWVLFAAALIASMKFKVGPIMIIIAGGILGYIIY